MGAGDSASTSSDAPGLAGAKRVHFVGIGGSGMAALAALLLQMGKTVAGSDVADSLALRTLRDAGATVHVGHRAENVDGADYLVRSAAVPADNPEVVEADRLGLPSVKLAQAVGELMRDRRGVGVAGTHGKTTTTALVAWLLERAGQDPTALIGAESLNFGSSARTGEGPMVVEADEFDRRFLDLSPEVVIVTSVEPDHLDYFRDLAEIQSVFQELVDKVPAHGRLIACADDPGARTLETRAIRETYGFADDADWRGDDYAPIAGGGSRFTLKVAGRSWPVESSLVGVHNARNAIAAIATVDHFGVGLRPALAALPAFMGTKRRFETRGRPGGVWIVDDYAHHPTAVAATLSAARDANPTGAIWAVFQPHTTNRTAALMGDFARAFAAADHALILPIYRPSGREIEAREVTSADLVARIRATGHPDTRFSDAFDAAEDTIEESVAAGDLVLVMGAGDVTCVADDLVRRLGAGR